MFSTIFINFMGGILSPGELLNILIACREAKVKKVRFGLRQQLLISVETFLLSKLTTELDTLQITYEVDENLYPNVVSSYPAEEVFIRNSWLSEGVYKDIFDTIDFSSRLKINICDGNQSITPILTGNLNWIAANAPHYWHLIVRFPKTNITFEWDKICYTNHIPAITRRLEEIIFNHQEEFIDNSKASGKMLFALLQTEDFIVKSAESPVVLPRFNLPYYEGINRYNDKYWLGIYRRDEWFSVDFLMKMCQLCLATKLGQLCCTSWKSIMIKGIEEKDKGQWNLLLEEFNINMRHAANELNFQVEDNCEEGLELKKYLVKHLNSEDLRTFGICIGIKTRKKSEVFSSIQIRQRYLIDFWNVQLFPVYDILCAKDFNPNERTGEVFCKGNLKIFIPEQLRRAIVKYYSHRNRENNSIKEEAKEENTESAVNATDYSVYQCAACLTVYDGEVGEPESDIVPGTSFELLPDSYCCPLCESDKSSFKKIKLTLLGLQIS